MCKWFSILILAMSFSLFGTSCQKSTFKGTEKEPESETKPTGQTAIPANDEDTNQSQTDQGSTADDSLGSSSTGTDLGETSSSNDTDIMDAVNVGTTTDIGDNVLDFGNDNAQSNPILDVIPEQIIQSLSLPNITPSSLTGPGGDTPLVLDANGDHRIATLAADQGRLVFFDVNGDGTPELSEWIAPGDWFLALDRDGDGRITSGLELFGDASLGLGANGFQALALLDDDLNGAIDAQDAWYSRLVVWADDNGNALTDVGELKSLSSVGISSINLSYQNTHIGLPSSQSFIGQVGAFTQHGQSKTIVDVYFRTQPTILSFAKGGL